MSSYRPKIVVVGCGLSGSMAAVGAAEHGADVLLLSHDIPCRSNSSCMREGVNAVFCGAGGPDSVDSHVEDTITGGCGLAGRDCVRRMCESAPKIVRLLERMGVLFDRTAEGFLKTERSCGSAGRRTVFAGGFTSRRALAALDGQLRRQASFGKVNFYFGFEFLSPIVDGKGVARGVVAANLKNMDVKSFPADAVIICTGGYPAVFGRSTASLYNDGAAAAACYRHGASFANPEFVQFHPYTIGEGAKRVPIREWALVHGARVSVSCDGNPSYFLEEQFPDVGGCVTRDVSARSMHACFQRLKLGGDHSECGALFDVTGIDPDIREEMLSDVMCYYEGVYGDDPRRNPMKVMPAAHLTLGGLSVDDGHKTSTQGLFAAGDAASKYHGANAIGGNEALSSLHGGMVAGRAAAEYARGLDASSGDVPASILESARTREEDLNSKIASREGGKSARAIARELGELLFAGAGIARSNDTLKRAAEKMVSLKGRLESAALGDRSEWANGEMIFMRRLALRLELAELIVAAALRRDESRGAHYKPEFPDRDDERWLVATRATWTADGPKFVTSDS